MIYIKPHPFIVYLQSKLEDIRMIRSQQEKVSRIAEWLCINNSFVLASMGLLCSMLCDSADCRHQLLVLIQRGSGAVPLCLFLWSNDVDSR